MADDNPAEPIETPPTEEIKIEGAPEIGDNNKEIGEGEQAIVEDQTIVRDQEKVGEDQEKVEGDQEKVEEDQEKVEGEQERVEGEQQQVEIVEGLPADGGEGAGEVQGETEEGLQGEQVPGEEEVQTTTEGPSSAPDDEMMGEEEQLPEELPPDPAAPLDLSDSKEALKLPFELSPAQLVVVESLWEDFQNHTPAYSHIDGFITPKELVYMLKALLLMTYTPEQMVELIEFCVRPPHPEGNINWEQFLHIVTIRQRDFILEEQIRKALEVFDPKHTGIVDREEIKYTVLNLGYKMTQKMVDNFIKEVDITGDGELNIEDIVGTMCIDLNQEDLQMLRDAVNPPKELPNMEDLDRDIERAEDATRQMNYIGPTST